jgi:hypothetical protein
MSEVMEMQETIEQTAPKAPRPKVSREEFEKKCLEQIGALLTEAENTNLNPSFVWAATWHLARVMHACGPWASADILTTLGGHLKELVEREKAHCEAEKAKAEGRLPH